jgi:hypothetical protein
MVKSRGWYEIKLKNKKRKTHGPDHPRAPIIAEAASPDPSLEKKRKKHPRGAEAGQHSAFQKKEKRTGCKKLVRAMGFERGTLGIRTAPLHHYTTCWIVVLL